MQKYFFQKNRKIRNLGFMMMDILISASIITAAILASMAVAQKSLSLGRHSFHAYQASFLLEEGAEAVRIFRDNGWSNISGMSTATTYYPIFSGGTWTMPSSSSTVGIFTRKVNIATVKRDATSGDIASSGTDDPGTKLITVTVSWQEGATTITKTLSFYIMDVFS